MRAQAVVFGPLPLLLGEQRGGLFAQGIDIDYAASGGSLEEAQIYFEKGLIATAQLHLRKFGSLERLLKFAPTSVWEGLKTRDTCSIDIIAEHDLPAEAEAIPFEQVQYLRRDESAKR